MALTGSLAAGAYLVIEIEAQNGAPDGVALVDTATHALLDALSYEGEITAAVIDGQTYDLVEGTSLAETVADSNTRDGSLSRIPDGEDHDDAAADWEFTTTNTPGAANVATQLTIRVPASGFLRRARERTRRARRSRARRARARARGSSPTARGRELAARERLCTAHPGSVSWRQSENRHRDGELDDVVERVLEPVVGEPEVELADAGVVDDDASAGEQDQLATRRRMPPRAVSATSPVSRMSSPTSALTSVDFPTPDGPSRAPVVPGPSRPGRVEAEAGARRHDRDRDVARDVAELVGDALRILLEVGLEQEDRGSRAALPGEREVALEQARARLVRERGGDEDDVDVGRDDLLAGDVGSRVVGRAARDLRPAREDGLDRRGVWPARSSATQSPTTGTSASTRDRARVRPGSLRADLAVRR